MGAGATFRSLPPGSAVRRRPGLGFTSTETLITLGIAGLLSAAGLATLNFHGVDLSVAQQELQGCLDQAFVQARASGRNVTLAPARDGGGPGIIPVHLPRRVKWGKPAHIPLPHGMADPLRADSTGESHARITVTPRRTVTSSAWFLHDGKEALCFRMSGHGRLNVLRFRTVSRRWERVG
jgi:type II secretory pathway pseudopilin PulG